MKIKQTGLFVLLLTSFSLLLSGCNFNVTGIKDLKEGDAKEAQSYENRQFFDFQESMPARLFSISDGYSNNGVFGSTWTKDSVEYHPEYGMKLKVSTTTDESKIKSDSGDPYLSAEIRTSTRYQYGYFGTYMKPSSASGTASTFFVYSSNPHDEIDIEFLGKNTTRVQFNYFKNGKGGHEYWYDLGFDASLEYHHYGFYWGRNEITWYVDFVPVYRLVGKDTPSNKCQVIANLWAGNSMDSGVMAWMGEVNPLELPSAAYYKRWDIADEYGNRLKVLPTGEEYNVCPKDNDLTAKQVSFKSVTGYTVANTSSTNEYEVTYTKEQIYKNYLCLKLNVDGVDKNKYIQTTIKNLSTDHPALVRLTVDTLSSDGTNSANTVLKVWKNGETSQVKISNHTEAIVEVNANEEAKFTVRWYGEGANILTWMFDDFGDCSVINGVGQRDGHVIIKDYKFGGVQDFVAEDSSSNVEELYTENGVIEDPDSDQAIIPEGYVAASAKFTSTSKYSVSENNDVIDINYNVAGSNYDAVSAYTLEGMANITSLIIVIKNNNRKQEYYQAKIRDAEKNAIVKKVNVLSATSTGRFDRFSSSNPGSPYFYISAMRTCQLEFELNGPVTIKDIGLIAAVGGAATIGGFTIKGIYAK